MARTAIITWLSGVCRVGEDCEKYGDPYEISFTLQWLSDGTYEIIGVDKPLTREDRVAIINAAELEEIKELITRRIASDGTARTNTTNVTKVHHNQSRDK